MTRITRMGTDANTSPSYRDAARPFETPTPARHPRLPHPYPSASSAIGFLCLACFLAPPVVAAEPPVTALAFTPDGRELVAGSQAGVVVRTCPGLEVLRSLETRLANVHDVAFSPDGTRLAVAGGAPGENGAVEVYAWPAGTLVFRAERHADVVYAVAWSPGGDRIATASLDRSVAILSADDGELATRLEGHSRGVTAVAFFGDDRLVTASVDQSVRLWSLGDGRLVRSLNNHTAAVHTLDTRPGVDPAAPPIVASAGADRTVRLWQPAIGRLVRFVRLPSEPLDLAWTPGGSRLVAACADGRVRVIDPATVEVLDEVAGVDGPAGALAVSRTGTAVGGTGGRVRVLESIGDE